MKWFDLAWLKQWFVDPVFAAPRAACEGLRKESSRASVEMGLARRVGQYQERGKGGIEAYARLGPIAHRRERRHCRQAQA